MQTIILLYSLLLAPGVSMELAGNKTTPAALSSTLNTRPPNELAEQNMQRAMALADTAIARYFVGETMAMARFYNPYTGIRSDEKGSVWMYTAAIEAVNAIMHALQTHHKHHAIYQAHYQRYQGLLTKLYDNLAYYQGTFQLTSYTQTRQWTVYGVHRANTKGQAKVAGRENVYDDQQWLVRELLHSHKLTGNPRYLEQAEYLTDYILDGWDSTPDATGKAHGGIPWGPGYTTKHACSNGPFISPLVWLHEYYKESDEKIIHRYIDAGGERKTIQMKKSDYYLQFAEAIYAWQKEHLLQPNGVYADFMGGCGKCEIRYQTVDGVRYRANTPLKDQVGPAYSYNSGSVVSGLTDLYRATNKETYLNDLKQLSDSSFSHFATASSHLPNHYEYAVSGFNNWFNGVLMRAYVEAYPFYTRVAPYIHTFQQNLDYGYSNFLNNGLLPPDLLHGWDDDNDHSQVEGMFAFTFAAEYALLSEYQLKNTN